MITFGNKTILIVGASSGIGRQCAVSCSKLGAKLILFGRNAAALNETKALLQGDNHLVFAQDIRETAEFETNIKLAVQKIGAIDGFTYSAGVQQSFPLRKHSREIFSNQFDVNAISAFETTRVLVKNKLINSAGGSIIYISSVRGMCGEANILAYSASKGALISGAKSLAIELADVNIRVNTVSPGMVEDTKMTQEAIRFFREEWATNNKAEYPLGWVSTADVANACLFLLSDLSMKITGTNLVVDGGFSAK